MSIEKTDAIVLRSQDLRETSLIVSFYTKDFGKIKGIIKGVRGPRPQQIGHPQLFTLNHLVFYERKKGDFCTVSHCDLKNFFPKIRSDLEKTAYASYFIDLLDAFTPLFDKNEAVFDILLNTLSFLSEPASSKRVARVYEIKLLNALGLMPELTSCFNCGSSLEDEIRFSVKNGGLVCKNCFYIDGNARGISKGTVNFIEHVKGTGYPLVQRIKVSELVGREIEALLREFIDFHLDRSLKSLDFFKKAAI